MFSTLKGKTVLVTGGNRGIGRSIVTLLARHGMNVAFTYNRNEFQAIELIESLKAEDVSIRKYKMNLEEEEAIYPVVSAIEDDFGGIDYLVNNAGIIRDNYMLLMDTEDWNKVLSTDLTGAFFLTKEVLPSMLAKKGGAIVNITSIAGLVGVPGQTNYCAAKAGLIGLTRALAKEVATKDIRVNAVAPGYVQTDMISDVDVNSDSESLAKIPLKRVASPDEIASVVLFLLSDGASYITGTTIEVDGGLTN